MYFTDNNFLFVFLPVASGLFHISSEKAKPYVILALSVLFYALCQRNAVMYGCILTALNVTVIMVLGSAGIEEQKTLRRTIMVAAIALNVGILVYYKYIENAIPIGLSFYTFKSISVICDAYRKDIKVKRPIDAINYLVFFGQIQSGPITRYASFTEKWKDYSFDDFSEGIIRFASGFSKKVLIADFLANIVNEVFAYKEPSTPYAWLGSICFSLQLYYDFSGYSDMAIGISRMFGIKCDENFNYPYAATSVSDFWRRWHITLGAWFRDYVYIPLGGSRMKTYRIIINLLVVWVLTGIWHGNTSGFIGWGICYFVVIAMEKLCGIEKRTANNKYFSAIYRFVVLFTVNILWVIFYFGSFDKALDFIKAMIIPQGYDISVERFKFLLSSYGVIIIVAILLATPIFTYVDAVTKGKRIEKYLEGVHLIAVGCFFCISVSMITAGASNPFVYVGF